MKLQDIIYSKKKQNVDNLDKSNNQIKDWINNDNFNNNVKEGLSFNIRKDSYIDTLECNETTFKSNKLNEINPYIILPEIKNNNNIINILKTIDNEIDNKNKLPKIKN